MNKLWWNSIREYRAKTGEYSVNDYALALFMEVAELTDSVQWKPWRAEGPTDVDNLTREAVDCMFFIVHILQLNGITLEELDSMFEWVLSNNTRRLTNGYNKV